MAQSLRGIGVSGGSVLCTARIKAYPGGTVELLACDRPVGKEGEKVGGRWYYSGGELGRPEVSYADSSPRDLMEAPGAYAFHIPAAGLSFVLVKFGGPNDRKEMVKNGEEKRAGQVGGQAQGGRQGRREVGVDGVHGPGRLGAA